MVRSLKLWKILILLTASVPLGILSTSAGLAEQATQIQGQAIQLAQASGSVETRDSVIVQCNALSNVVNKAVDEAKKVAEPEGDPIAKLAEAAEALEQYALELEALALSDPQLEGFKQRFIRMYRNTSQASRQLIAAVEKRDSVTAEAALGDLQTAIRGEDTLVSEVNVYCQAGR